MPNRGGDLRRLAGQPAAQDAAIAFVLTLMAQAQLGEATSADRLITAVVTASTAFRRRWPVFVCLVVGVGVALVEWAPGQPSALGVYLAVILAAYTVAERTPVPQAVLGMAALAIGVAAHNFADPEGEAVTNSAGDLFVPIVVWGLGLLIRRQSQRAKASQAALVKLEAEGVELTRQAIEAERAHLARELHDVVTHSVTVVVIQAQGAERVLGPGQPEVREALQAIEEAGRSALMEMRRMLGLLSPDVSGENDRRPLPGIQDLPALVEGVSSGRIDVRLDMSGSLDRIEASLGLTIYRIVQEALTNVLNHSDATHAAVNVVRAHDGGITVTVSDDGHPPAPTAHGTGRGLTGLEERLAAFDGHLSLGTAQSGGFVLTASIPASAQLNPVLGGSRPPTQTGGQ